MSPNIVRSVCPYDCPDTCGLLVEVEEGRAVRVSGDPAHPLTRGLLCPKMNHYERTVHSPRRLTTPLLRTGPKGEGRFEPLPWDEAIERICSRWKELLAGYGGECVLPYSYAGTMGLVQRNSGHPFFYKLGASRLERTICSPAKEAGWKALMGDTAAMEPAEIEQSDLVILWGINAAATSIHTMRDARTARRRGARLWAIDTYRTPTCEAADEAFIVRPGGDGALALGMMHVMVREGLTDRGLYPGQRGRVRGVRRKGVERLHSRSGCRRSAACPLPSSNAWRGSLRPQRRPSSAWGAASPATATAP